MIKWQWLRFEQLSTEQLYQIIGLREAVFVVEQNCPYQDVDGRDQNAWHLLGTQSNQLLAYARAFEPTELDSSIGRVVTAASARGQGLGQQLMQHAIHFCQAQWPKANIHISAQRYLENFYQGLGFAVCSEPYLEDNIPHIGMEIVAKR
ncbi:GNAT family N-acetyltransferase [Agarivorans sp. MS3-6]|uniref:GNAT family N-acetyltransferase n=1 Tax=Agarivorans sp. TSD2052 TaxID=2937286 RepID=UPI00200BC62A|nr:GNAT family N-acetyltransferase [Agarivorans sp. TSD2052]UPW18471.1 GNAT family N-acetyltransferase [Agarivorans sp. TSD2052]